MKTFLTETISLLVCILAAAAVSWVVNWVIGPFPVGIRIAGAIAVFAVSWFLRASTVRLLLSIELGTALSWISLYAFWFAVRTFHSVPVARACDALGGFILLPAKWVFEMLGGDQSTQFSDPVSYFGTNGLAVGILIYCVLGATLRRRVGVYPTRQERVAPRPVEAKVG